MGCTSSKEGKEMGITNQDLQEIEYRRRNTSLVELVQTGRPGEHSVTNVNKMSTKEKEDLLNKMQKEKEESLRLKTESDAKVKAANDDQDEESKSAVSYTKSQGSRRSSSSSMKKKQGGQDDDDDDAFKSLKKAAEVNMQNNRNINQVLNPNGINLEMKNKSSVKPPPICTGYMAKQGQVFRSWKTRFFVLKEGILTYYIGETMKGSKVGDNQVGSPLLLMGYQVSQPEPGQLFLTIPGRRTTIADNAATRERTATTLQDEEAVRSILLQVTNEQDLEMWQKALKQHIIYINSISIC